MLCLLSELAAEFYLTSSNCDSLMKRGCYFKLLQCRCVLDVSSVVLCDRSCVSRLATNPWTTRTTSRIFVISKLSQSRGLVTRARAAGVHRFASAWETRYSIRCFILTTIRSSPSMLHVFVLVTCQQTMLRHWTVLYIVRLFAYDGWVGSHTFRFWVCYFFVWTICSLNYLFSVIRRMYVAW